MKITRRPASGLPDVGGSAPIGDAVEGESTQRHRSTDRVELSQGARLRAHLRREIGDVSAISTERVQALRAEIAAGTYHRDPRVVAERFLVDVAGELLT